MRLSALLLLPVLAACSDYNLQQKPPGAEGDPIIDVTPDALYYSDVAMGESGAQVFTVRSAGEIALDVTDIVLDTGTSFTWASMDGKLPGLLEPGASADITVTYTRSGDGEVDRATVLSNDMSPDPDNIVDLFGGETMPELVLDPDHWDAGANPVGVTTTGSIDIVSTGDAPVTVSAISITGEGFDGGWAEALPFTLNPGERSTVNLEFTAPDIGVYSGQLTVEANDTVATHIAPLSGEGAGGPIAVCYANPDEVAANAEATTWYGADSYDSGGRSLTEYRWTLVEQPSGSGVSITGSGANRRFTPDLAGEYIAELIVVNDVGQESEPCYATLNATPSQDLWIEMYWDASEDDQDLHLVRPSGTLRTNGDCYFANTNPDWGVRGDPLDDPSLDLDDIPGTGPENINIAEPEDGTFAVWVDDYSGSTGDRPSVTNVTVNIYVGGSLEYTGTKACSRECADMHFADVSWPDGTITSY